MSVDVEEWYQGEFLRQGIDTKPHSNVVHAIQTIVDLFESYKTKATFFVVGETLLKYPECGELILNAGHDLGYHGWDHRPLWDLNPREFKDGLIKFQELLDEWTYTPVAFRAPSASLDNRSIWLFKQLANAGYHYDSSIYPCYTPLYGVPGAPIYPYWPSKNDVGIPVDSTESWGLLEFPFLAFGPKQLRLPLGTGFYLRFFPLRFYGWALKQRERQRIPAVISFHTWEFISDIPDIQSSIIQDRYLQHGIGHCRPRVEGLLQKYSFTSIREIARKLR